jgi:hypothetical protein
MYVVTEDAQLICRHRLGEVQIQASQSLVTIQARKILVEPDPEGKPIKGCPNYGPTIKPCGQTLVVRKGYSEFVRIEQRPVCLDSVTGLTDGTPPGSVPYVVHAPGQNLLSIASRP